MSIKSEFDKLVAQSLFDYCKQHAPDAIKALGGVLKRNGQGLPAPIHDEFEKAFLEVVGNELGHMDGSGVGNGGTIYFRLTEPLVKKLAAHVVWSDFAENTSQGQEQIDLVGGRDSYNAAIRSAIPAAFVARAEKCLGEVLERRLGGYWVILAMPHTEKVDRPRGNWQEQEVLFFDKSDDAKALKKRKGNLEKFLKKRPVQWSDGPHLLNKPQIITT